MEAAKETKFGHKGSLGDEDDAQASNARTVQRKHAIPHSRMKNTRNVIECCNNTHQGVPHTGKQMCACDSDLCDGNCITCKVVILGCLSYGNL